MLVSPKDAALHLCLSTVIQKKSHSGIPPVWGNQIRFPKNLKGTTWEIEIKIHIPLITYGKDKSKSTRNLWKPQNEGNNNNKINATQHDIGCTESQLSYKHKWKHSPSSTPSKAEKMWMPKRKKNSTVCCLQEIDPKQNNRETKNKGMFKYKTGTCKHKESGLAPLLWCRMEFWANTEATRCRSIKKRNFEMKSETEIRSVVAWARAWGVGKMKS